MEPNEANMEQSFRDIIGDNEQSHYLHNRKKSNCQSITKIECDRRDSKSSYVENTKQSVEKRKILERFNYFLYLGIFICLIIVIMVLYGFSLFRSMESNSNIEELLKKLKEKYPNQKNSLWQNIRKIISEPDSVHSFVLLYKENDDVTAECFTTDLFMIFKKMYNIEDIVVYQTKNHAEFGEELVHYQELVRKNKHMIVPKLQDMKGETARMFHTLCDVGYNSIKPSYIIFTLQDLSGKIGSDLEEKLPTVRVANILRNLWSNLLDSELHPLISRIVRNVAEISTVNITCS